MEVDSMYGNSESFVIQMEYKLMRTYGEICKALLMATKTGKVQARVDPRLKASAEHVFHQLGITATDAIGMFYAQVDLQRGLPFEVKIPNDVTRKALLEAEHPEDLESYDSVEELFADLG